jgi:hypothetical protein
MCPVFSASPEEHTKPYTSGFNWHVAIFAAKKEHYDSTNYRVLAELAGVVDSAVGCLVEHIDDHLNVAQAAGLKVVATGEFLPPGVQVHLVLPVKQNLIGTHAKAIASFPRLQFTQLGAVDELNEVIRETLDAEMVLLNAEEELKASRLLRRR